MTEVRIVRPASRWPTLNLREVYDYRELLWVFVRRGIWTRYRQMALGITWSFLEPLGLLVLMSLVFGYLIKIPTDGYPFPIFMASALIPWTFFSKGTTAAANSLSEHISIISKVYFPRIILPIAGIVREYFDSIVLFVILVGLSWAYGFPPTLKMLLLPLVLAVIMLPALGLGMSVAAVSIKYRDFRPLLTIILQVGYYATPVFYPASLIPPAALPIYQLNPMYWFVEIARWAMLDKPLHLTMSFPISMLISALLVVAGYYIFATYERGAVDAQ
jgi:lipopolysaccharide transport system permease protein